MQRAMATAFRLASILLFASALVASAAQAGTYALTLFAKRGAIRLPMDTQGYPRAGIVVPLDSIAFGPQCALKATLLDIGCVGLVKEYPRLKEGADRDTIRDEFYDEACSRAYKVYVGATSRVTGEAWHALRDALLRNACIDSVANLRPEITVGHVRSPHFLTPPHFRLPDSKATGRLVLSLSISASGTVDSSSIEWSTLADSCNQAVLDAARQLILRPASDGCRHMACRVSIPLSFRDGESDDLESRSAPHAQ